MVSRAKRASNNRWDADNMTVLGCKVRRDRAERFKAACKASGTTPNAVFNRAIDETLKQYQSETE